MIDICFSEMFGETLLEIKDAIKSDGILPLDLNLNYGRLDCDIVKEQVERTVNTLKYFYKSVTEEELHEEYIELLEDIRGSLNQLEQILSEGEDIRLWLNNNAHDRCGLYWFCDFSKNYSNRISIVSCPGYEYISYLRTAQTVNTWQRIAMGENTEFIAHFASVARTLNEHEKMAYAREWNLLVKQDALLRILIDNYVVGVKDSFFDNIILDYVEEDPQPQEKIMGKMLGKWQGGCDVAFISERIEHLIADGKVKVCEDKIDENDCYWPRTISLT